MVALFGFPADSDVTRRKRPVTYGKLSRATPKPNGTSHLQATRRPSLTRGDTPQSSFSSRLPSANRIDKDAYDLSSSESEHGQPGSRNARTAKVTDEFDVPSSDEDTPRTKAAPKKAASSSISQPRNRQPSIRSAVVPAGSQASDESSKKRKRSVADASQKKATQTIKEQAAPVPAGRSIDEEHVPKSPAQRKPVAKRASLQGESSAPARLSGMVWQEMKESPEKQRTTPARRSMGSPATLRKTVSLTPKQSQLWSQLLDDESTGTGRVSNSKTAGWTSPTQTVHPQIVDTTSNLQPPRLRLADRLKQYSQQLSESQGNSDSFGSDESSSESEDMKTMGSQRTLAQATGQLSNYHSQVTEASARAKNTYSQSRSYLQETLSFEESLLRPLIADDIDAPGTRGTSDLDSEGEASQGIRTVHELRAAGERKRFLDDLESMLEDASDHSRSALSKRRHALMDFYRKSVRPEFKAKFLESPFVASMVEEFATTTPPDVIADSILLAILAVLTSSAPKRQVADLLCSARVARWASQYIGDSRTLASIAKDRSSNMSKVSQETLLEFMDEVRQGPIWEPLSPAVLRIDLLSLQAIANALKCLHKTGQHQVMLSSVDLDKIGAYLVNGEPDNIVAKHSTLAILELESLPMVNGGIADMWSAQLVKDIISSFTQHMQESAAPEAILLPLRLLLNITNDKAWNCDVFTHVPEALQRLLDGVIQGFTEATDQSLDVLLLSLGLAINLAEHSSAVRSAVAADSIRSLTHLFVSGQERASEAQSLQQSRENIACGYVGILLCNLCLEPGVRRRVVIELPGGDVDVLLRGVEEFIGYHRRVDMGHTEEEDEDAKDEAWSGFTMRLGAVVQRLRDA